MFKKLMVPAIAGLILAPSMASSATITELEERILKLEEETMVSTESIYDLNTKDEDQVKMSGYFDTELHSHTNENVDFLRVHHLGLFFEKNLGDSWRFFTEVEFEDGPKFEGEDGVVEGEGTIFLESVNISYLWRNELNLRFGRMYNPAGIWSVDHYPIFVPTQQIPNHILKIFPQVLDGVQAYGTLGLGSSFLTYDLTVSNGEGSSGHKDENQSKAKGLKLSVVLPALDHFEVGTT